MITEDKGIFKFFSCFSGCFDTLAWCFSLKEVVCPIDGERGCKFSKGGIISEVNQDEEITIKRGGVSSVI